VAQEIEIDGEHRVGKIEGLHVARGVPVAEALEEHGVHAHPDEPVEQQPQVAVALLHGVLADDEVEVDLDAPDAVVLLQAALQRVLESRQPVEMRLEVVAVHPVEAADA